MRGDRNILSNVLLVAIAVAGGVLAWAFIASVLSQLQSSTSTSSSVSVTPLRIDATYQTDDGNICLVVRNPNTDPIPLSSLRAYVYKNQKLVKTYDSFTSSCGSEIPGRASCKVCTPSDPPFVGGSADIHISADGSYASAPIYIHTPLRMLRYSCASCSECNAALNDAAAKIVAREFDRAIVSLSTDISQSSSVCISLYGYDTKWRLIFDGNGHEIVGGTTTVGIVLKNVTGVVFSDLNLSLENNGIVVDSSALRIQNSDIWGNYNSLYVVDTNDVYIESSRIGGDSGITIVNGSVHISSSSVDAATGVYFSGGYAHLYVDLATANVTFCPEGEGGGSFDGDSAEGGFLGDYNIFCSNCDSGNKMYYADNPYIDESLLLQCATTCVDFCP